MWFKRRALSIDDFVKEVQTCLALVGVQPKEYFLRQMERGAANFSDELRTKDVEKRRRSIVIKLLADGTIPKHRFEYMNRTAEFPEKLNAWYQGGENVG